MIKIAKLSHVLLVHIFIITITIAAFTSSADALKCAYVNDTYDWTQHDYLFTGTIIASQPVDEATDHPKNTEGLTPKKILTVKPHTLYKGSLQDEYTIYVYYLISQPNWQVGEDYLFELDLTSDNKLIQPVCSASGSFKERKKALKKLKKDKLTLFPETPKCQTDDECRIKTNYVEPKGDRSGKTVANCAHQSSVYANNREIPNKPNDSLSQACRCALPEGECRMRN